MKDRITNRKFAKEDEKFLQACVAVEFNPTTRQASKFRNKKGKVYKKLTGICLTPETVLLSQ